MSQQTAQAQSTRKRKWLSWLSLFVAWFDSAALEKRYVEATENLKPKTDWLRLIPFWTLHLACLGVFFVGWGWFAVGWALAWYALRMFAITGFYHRFFSHRSYKTSRFSQFLFASLGNMAVQRGALWWASHHRHHHSHSDQEDDVHSPITQGFIWAHMGWITSKSNYITDMKRIRDFARFPELRFLNRFDLLVPTLVIVWTYFVGVGMEYWFPEGHVLHTTGWQLVIWMLISTVVLFHATSMINSMAHLFGKRRYRTGDYSRNSLLLALITFGEGWHNNHHHYQLSVRQGFYWYEVDVTYYILKMLSWTGLIWDLRCVPEHVRSNGQYEESVSG